MLGTIEELLALVVLDALVALRFFEAACGVLELELELVLARELGLVLEVSASASASAASAALACSAAVPAAPAVPVPVLAHVLELVLAELFSVAPAGSLG